MLSIGSTPSINTSLTMCKTRYILDWKLLRICISMSNSTDGNI